MQYNPIYAIGDSHTTLFAGANKPIPMYPEKHVDVFPFFKAYHIGAITAYNLCEEKSTTWSRRKLFEILEKEVPKGSKVMIIAGEVDCRSHIIKEAKEKNRAIADVAIECVDRLFQVLKEVKNLGYDVIAWGVTPSALGQPGVKRSNISSYGSYRERNLGIRLFNYHLMLHCDVEGIPLVNIFPKLINDDDTIKKEFYLDNAHLAPVAIDMVVAEMMNQNIL